MGASFQSVLFSSSVLLTNGCSTTVNVSLRLRIENMTKTGRSTWHSLQSVVNDGRMPGCASCEKRQDGSNTDSSRAAGAAIVFYQEQLSGVLPKKNDVSPAKEMFPMFRLIAQNPLPIPFGSFCKNWPCWQMSGCDRPVAWWPQLCPQGLWCCHFL